MSRTALLIGITGNIGGAVARALLIRGWRIRALHRRGAAPAFTHTAAIDWIQGDAMNGGEVVAAADGADIIVHAVNPPGYRNWCGLAIPMLANTIGAARASGARVLFPGNVYNYGPDAGALVGETAPQNPKTRKGRIRVEMEAMLKAEAGVGLRAVVLRAGDFFGPHCRGAWFDGALVKAGKPVKSVTYPGDHAAGHAWAYLPDLAETFARLAEREAELDTFETFHFGGHYLERGDAMVDAIRRVAGVPDAPVRKLPWLALHAAAPFHETSRELLEMRYLWLEPLQLDNRKLVGFLGAEPHTPLDAAVHAALTGLGCITPTGDTEAV